MQITRTLPFTEVEKAMRESCYGVLGTIDGNGNPHSTSVLYGVSLPDDPFSLYVVTSRSYKKIRNIEARPEVSFVIPFPHHIMRFVPPNCVQFQGIAELYDLNFVHAYATFLEKKTLKMTLADAMQHPNDNVFIRIIPNQRINGYGLGMSMMEMRNNIRAGAFKSNIPKERLAITEMDEYIPLNTDLLYP